MTTPSGQISAQDIKNEFGETGEGKVALGSYRVSQTCGELTLAIGDGVPTSGTISYDNMRGKRLNIVVDYYSGGTITRQDQGDNTTDARHRYNNQNDKVTVIGGLKSKPSDTSPHRVRIHVNKTIGGKRGDRNFCALRTGTGWESGTALIVEVGGEGAIYGGGGDGGEGGNSNLDAGNPGGDGASALGIQYNGTNINVASGGLIRCGFGGGGGGGSGRQHDKGGDRRAGGGGGGGGQGFPGGAGGDRGRGEEGATDGTAGDISEAGEGGGGGNNHNQAYGSSGGEGGGQGEAADAGGSGNHGGGSGGAQGAAIRKTAGISFSLTNNGSIVGSTSANDVS